jgi:hyperosmotically inducible protein
MAPPAGAQATASRPHDTHTSSTATQTSKQHDSTQADPDKGNAVTDGWITMKVHAKFIPEDALSDSDIDVTTRNGVVTLSGTVPTVLGRQRAVEIAKATDGVKNVVDQLRIAPETATSLTERTGDTGREAGRETTGATAHAGRHVSDGWIKSKIYGQFASDEMLDRGDVNLDVDNGIVTLKGSVPSQAARDRAMTIAKSTDGVRSVQDRLKVSANQKH